MTKPANSASSVSREEKSAKIAELMSNSASAASRQTSEDEGYEKEDGLENIVIVRIPARFTEEKVKTLMGSMEAQFEGSGYKIVFVPEEVGVHLLGPQIQDKSRWV